MKQSALDEIVSRNFSAPDVFCSDAFGKRYAKAVVRNFDGKAGAPTEMDALIAYLQMLGTLVDFKLYNEKANLR